MLRSVSSFIGRRAALPWRRLAVAVWLAAPLSTVAANYAAPIDKASWQVERSPRSCRLSQAIPRFGAAVFESRAGAGQQFYLAPERRLAAGGTGQLVAAAPFWNPERQPVELGAVAVSTEPRSVQLQDPLAQRLLQLLGNGLVPELHLAQPDLTLRIGVMPIRFRHAYQEYRACTARLPAPAPRVASAAPAPRNDNRVRFNDNRWQLDAAARAQLDRLARRLDEDSTVAKVIVEGHSSDSYRRMLNLELSRRRAEAVTAYLVEHGVDPQRVTTRYFGARYAAVTDRSVRHVEVRLQRAEN
jgi:outer membrane protein OmpA-like peptidoglycan-associated protein